MSVQIKKDKIKKYMFIEGMNITLLASTIGVNTSYLNQIINGNKNASPRIAKKLSEALQVKVEDLFTIEIK